MIIRNKIDSNYPSSLSVSSLSSHSFSINSASVESRMLKDKLESNPDYLDSDAEDNDSEADDTRNNSEDYNLYQRWSASSGSMRWNNSNSDTFDSSPSNPSANRCKHDDTMRMPRRRGSCDDESIDLGYESVIHDDNESVDLGYESVFDDDNNYSPTTTAMQLLPVGSPPPLWMEEASSFLRNIKQAKTKISTTSFIDKNKDDCPLAIPVRRLSIECNFTPTVNPAG